MLRSQPAGNYCFLTGGGVHPFCDAVLPDTGYEIVRAQLNRPVGWREGFDLIEQHLTGLGRPRQALCSIELRCAEPYTPEGFASFNVGYASLTHSWGLVADGASTTTRTNVAPDYAAPGEQVLFAFGYTVPAPSSSIPTWIISGATEGDGVRPGESSPSAMREKVASVVSIIGERIAAIEASWEAATQLSLYTAHDVTSVVAADLLPRMGVAGLNGVRWYPSRPPIVGLELEIDARAIRDEIRL